MKKNKLKENDVYNFLIVYFDLDDIDRDGSIINYYCSTHDNKVHFIATFNIYQHVLSIDYLEYLGGCNYE